MIVASIIVMFVCEGDKPNMSTKVSSFVILVGALVAVWETFETDWVGFALSWACNFSQALQNVYTRKWNSGN